ncbi:hypothetical protein CMO83_02525 [Candidatus Woesearchaeota archaeon]|nr:hypothetical protein [Candidatus Woesearchaeota archaeon]
MFQFYKNYMEFFFLILTIIGLLFALLAPSAVISYIIIFISGLFAGRVIYERKSKIVFPYLVIIAGFLIGYLIGARYGNHIFVFVLFLVGAVLSYKLYDKKILRDTRY